jgi:hypothetical protein
MSKVLFTAKYTIESEKINEFEKIISELKNHYEGNEEVNYKIYKVSGKKNTFKEIYEYANKEVWEKSDDEENEGIDILMSQLSDLIVSKTTEYSTLFELE